jgi:adenylate kinase family enzyme
MRVLFTGAAGSGTTTLAKAFARQRGFAFLDADDFFWLPTEPPYRQRRAEADRLTLLSQAMGGFTNVAVSRSIPGWGQQLEQSFNLVVFLYVPAPVRLQRLHEREIARFGHADTAFLEWAALYDAGPPEGRSLARHRAWLLSLVCPVIHFEGEHTVEELLLRLAES